MMDRDTWLSKILETVSWIASAEYQSKAWFGLGDSVSSPGELYNALFDDLTFPIFFEMHSVDFSQAQNAAWKELEDRLEAYAKVMPETMDPATVFSDSRWKKIRESARRFGEVFRQTT